MSVAASGRTNDEIIRLAHADRILLRALMEGVVYQMRWALEHAAAFGEPLERVAEPLAQAAGLAEPDDGLLKAVIRP
jgi:hypothetical protein